MYTLFSKKKSTVKFHFQLKYCSFFFGTAKFQFSSCSEMFHWSVIVKRCYVTKILKLPGSGLDATLNLSRSSASRFGNRNGICDGHFVLSPNREKKLCQLLYRVTFIIGGPKAICTPWNTNKYIYLRILLHTDVFSSTSFRVELSSSFYLIF